MAGLTNVSGAVDEETWEALGRGMPSYQLRLIVTGSSDDHQLLGLLNGSFAGGGLKLNAETVLVVGDDDVSGQHTITYTGKYWYKNEFGKYPVR